MKQIVISIAGTDGNMCLPRDSYMKCSVAAHIILAVSLLGTSCAGESTASEISLADLLEGEKKVCDTQVQVVAAIDQTQSMEKAGTKKAQTDDFVPIVERLTDCGGELGVLFIRGSVEPIERLVFPEPPSVPEEPVKGDDEAGYEFSDRVTEYHKNLIERRNKIQKSRQDLQPKIEQFFARLKPLLERPPAMATDLNSALNRADIFLAEDAPVPRSKAENFLILVSDAIDTRRKPRFPFQSKACVIWVNTTTHGKSLASLESTRVESFQAAVEIVVKVTVKKK